VRHPQIDGLSINLCLADEIILGRERTSDGWLVQTTGGLTWSVPYNDIGTVSGREITSFDDPRLVSDNPFKAGPLGTLAALPRAMLQSHLVLAGVTGPFSQVAFLMGLERVLLATVDDPEGLYRAIEKRLPHALEWVDQTAPYDPPAIWIGEGVASSNLISPKVYRDFVLPFEKKLCERIRAAGIPSVLHICGRLAPAELDLIATSGVDCLEADWPMDLVGARSRLGAGMALKGNLNTTTLVQAGPETIERISRELVDSLENQPGFILSSGCALGRDTPPENVEAMARAVQDD
jgi:uroporphyrinogen decarboxylase